MYHCGTIIQKRLASPTVLLLELNVPSLSSFLPGQWVDFRVPSYSWIGGFSIASRPSDLPNLTLAIKKSSHTPAKWIHEMSQVGQEVQVQVGGSCVLPPVDSTFIDNFASLPPRIFCAGGIGISPILCQYREFLEQRAAYSTPATPGPSTRFLYTVSHQSELVFGEELVDLAKKAKDDNPNDQMVFSLTQASSWDLDSNKRLVLDGVELKIGRVMKQFLDDVPKNSIYFLCGPPKMLDDAVRHLLDVRGEDNTNIYYEKWW